MKNKFKISDILFIGALGLIFCLGVSILFQKAFDISSDFLSSSATLFAAIVAMYLYSDWREQYHVSSIEKQQLEIFNLCDLLFENYISMVSFSVRNKNINAQDASAAGEALLGLMEHVQRLDNTLFKLRIAFKNYLVLLSDFEEISREHIVEIKKYEGFLINMQSFIDALHTVDNSKKILEVYDLHFKRDLSENLNYLWNSCKGEMQGFLISLLKK